MGITIPDQKILNSPAFRKKVFRIQKSHLLTVIATPG